MKNIFDVLKESHEKQRLLLETLMETSGESPARKEFYQNLKHELEQHSAAEERFFYAPLIESDTTIDVSRHGIAEHHQFDKLLAQLDSTDMSSPSWINLMKTLRHKVLHHLEDEEKNFFPLAGKVMTDNQKIQLADGYVEEMTDKS